MELHTQLKSLATKVDKLKDQITNEESTKHAFVLPFINILGYDAFNPMEVVPEFTADIGMKKGEKVDYAIYQNGEPILIVECKHWTSSLDVHNSAQLFRYFHVTKTRFALLTNGITYKFYTDLEDANKMDEKPFFLSHLEASSYFCSGLSPVTSSASTHLSFAADFARFFTSSIFIIESFDSPISALYVQ